MSAQPAKADDDEPDPISAIRMEMAEQLPPEFRSLVYEYGLHRRVLARWLVREKAQTPMENDARAEKG